MTQTGLMLDPSPYVNDGAYSVDMPPNGRYEGYVCAFEVEAGNIVKAAPIMRKRWLGQPVLDYAAWARKRGATFQRLGPWET